MKYVNLVVIVFYVLLGNAAFAQTRINKIADDHYEIILKDSDRDSVSILQVTDLHLGNKGKWAADFTTTRRIKTFVKTFQPDMLFVTGDLFTGEKQSQENLIAFAAQFFDDLERPWIFVFGNHDVEGGVSRRQIWQIFKDTSWGILGFHTLSADSAKYDFQVDLKSNDSATPCWEIYAFDSGSEKGNKSIKADQVQWFQRQSQESKKSYGKIIPAVSIFHIPLKQYQMLWDDATLPKTGEYHETVCFEEDDGSVYQAFLQQGNIRACFCGHDHDNNYHGKYRGGILLAYGHVSGEAGYHRYWEPGAMLISLPKNDGEIGIRELLLPDDK